MNFRPAFLAAGLLALLSLPVGAAETPKGAAAEAAAVVTSFSEAISARNLDGAVGHLAAGGVQFSLRPAHEGMGAQQGLTTDLKRHWSMVASLLFSATTSYTRSVEILDTYVDGDLATVWTRTSSETLQKGHAEPIRSRFVEVYLLVRQDNQWKIGAIADNRQPDPVLE
jgi:hypothetical protein